MLQGFLDAISEFEEKEFKKSHAFRSLIGVIAPKEFQANNHMLPKPVSTLMAYRLADVLFWAMGESEPQLARPHLRPSPLMSQVVSEHKPVNAKSWVSNQL